MPELQRLRAEHAPALLAFELENRSYFAASVPERGDDFFAEFDTRFATLLGWQADGTDHLHLLVAEDGEIVGRVNLVEVTDGSAELGYRIAEKAAGQGLATAAVLEVIGLAGAEYGLSLLRARTWLENVGSRAVLVKAGFEVTGQLLINDRAGITYERKV